MTMPKFKKRHLLIIILILIVGLLIIFGIKSINGNSVGTFQTGNSKSTKNVPVPAKVVMMPVKNKYASFFYPSDVSTYPSNKAVYPTLLDLNYVSHGFSTTYISISILDISGDNLATNNAYQTRKLNPSVYKQTSLEINGQAITVMTSNDASGYNEIAFLVSPKWQAIISLSNDLGQQDQKAQTAAIDILKSWHWFST
jgi:hypothetical protein